MDAHADGWFSELNAELWPGQCLSLKYKEVLFKEKSPYQEIAVLATEDYGRVLLLDGIVQLTERDEFAYHEMLAHLPLCAHGSAESVCIVGGGDGGVVREVCRHAGVKRVVLCEIDELVIATAKRFFPKVASALGGVGGGDASESPADPRVTVHVGDGAAFVREHPGEFDVIITDSSDPLPGSPATALFEREYYSDLRDALRDGGIIATQAECMWLHLDLIKKMVDFSRELYDTAAYAYTCIPTYPSGQIGFILGAKGKDKQLKKPAFELRDADLKYYSPEIHEAAFVLPAFADRKLNQ
jgi:spermidine synthase